MKKKITFDDLFALKCQCTKNIMDNTRKPTWYDYVVTAKTKKDFIMDVWNGTHPVEKNSIQHICKAGTKVRIWMVSRFGDAGITDILKNPIGYNCRGVDVDKDLEDITLKPKSKSTKPYSSDPTPIPPAPPEIEERILVAGKIRKSKRKK